MWFAALRANKTAVLHGPQTHKKKQPNIEKKREWKEMEQRWEKKYDQISDIAIPPILPLFISAV